MCCDMTTMSAVCVHCRPALSALLTGSAERRLGDTRRQPLSSQPVGAPGGRAARLLVRAAAEDDDFEARLAKIQKNVPGKKAEIKKARKAGEPFPDESAAPSKKESKKESVFLPPLPLQDPVSEGLTVQPGFTAYAERLHGRMALLGLAALLSVELYSGKGLLQFHDSATLTVQLYVVISASAVFVKSELNKTNVMPPGKN